MVRARHSGGFSSCIAAARVKAAANWQLLISDHSCSMPGTSIESMFARLHRLGRQNCGNRARHLSARSCRAWNCGEAPMRAGTEAGWVGAAIQLVLSAAEEAEAK